MTGDWLYSRDAGAAIAAVARRPKTQGLFNLGAGRREAPTEWAVAIGLPPPTIDPERPNIVARAPSTRPALDIARLRAAIGFAGGRATAEAAADHAGWLNETRTTERPAHDRG